jgi:hypothetical protein
MGADASDPPSSPATEATKRLENFNAAYLAADRDPGDITTSVDKPEAVAGRNLCGLAQELARDFSRNAAVEFNEAKCAEEQGRPEEAARLLGEYLKLAPKALDGPDIEVRRGQLGSLAALPDEPGKVERQHYALAARYLRRGGGGG